MGKKHWKEESRISRQRNKYSCREYKMILSSSFNSYMNDCFLHICVRIHFWSMSSKILWNTVIVYFSSHMLVHWKTFIVSKHVYLRSRSSERCLNVYEIQYINFSSYNEFVKMAYRGLILVNLIKMVLNVI